MQCIIIAFYDSFLTKDGDPLKLINNLISGGVKNSYHLATYWLLLGRVDFTTGSNKYYEIILAELELAVDHFNSDPVDFINDRLGKFSQINLL